MDVTYRCPNKVKPIKLCNFYMVGFLDQSNREVVKSFNVHFELYKLNNNLLEKQGICNFRTHYFKNFELIVAELSHVAFIFQKKLYKPPVSPISRNRQFANNQQRISARFAKSPFRSARALLSLAAVDCPIAVPRFRNRFLRPEKFSKCKAARSPPSEDFGRVLSSHLIDRLANWRDPNVTAQFVSRARKKREFRRSEKFPQSFFERGVRVACARCSCNSFLVCFVVVLRMRNVPISTNRRFHAYKGLIGPSLFWGDLIK